jgi:hypothetical protein
MFISCIVMFVNVLNCQILLQIPGYFIHFLCILLNKDLVHWTLGSQPNIIFRPCNFSYETLGFELKVVVQICLIDLKYTERSKMSPCKHGS